MTSGFILNQLLPGHIAHNAHNVLQVVLKGCPAVLKWVIALLFLINIRSWPLVWHYKVLFLPIFEIRIRYYALLARTLFLSKQRRLAEKDRFLKELCPVGEDPLSFTVSVPAWAGPDDCDFNWHLSNSSYPKQLDWARFRAALRICPTFYRAGGWMPLAATHFKFIREIPIFAKYEMRMSVAAWDSKWLFVVIRFVTLKKPKSRSSPKRIQVNGNGHSAEKPTPSGDSAPFPSLHTPAQPSDISSPEAESGSTTPLIQVSSSGNAAERIAQLLPTEEPDGATVHCISVSELCFKIGRITIPPALVLACEGFVGAQPTNADGSPAQPFSLANPPPHFVAAQELQKKDLPKGHMKTFQAFLKGGWRDVPDDERWWDKAFQGHVEERRKRNLEAIHGVRTGMEGALRANVPM